MTWWIYSMAMFGLVFLLLLILAWEDVKKAFLATWYQGKIEQLEKKVETFDKIQSTTFSDGYRRRLQERLNILKGKLKDVTGKE